jgi:hypothetical protein
MTQQAEKILNMYGKTVVVNQPGSAKQKLNRLYETLLDCGVNPDTADEQELKAIIRSIVVDYKSYSWEQFYNQLGHPHL